MGNELGAANALRHLAGVYRHQEEWELAIEMAKQAYEIHVKNPKETYGIDLD